MTRLFEIGGPAVLRWTCDYPELANRLTALRTGVPPMTAVNLRGKKMRTRQGMFDEFAAALQFPYYFGENWNAFYECIGDLDWLREDPIALFLMDSTEVLVEADPDEFGLLVLRLTEIAESWTQSDEFRPARPFHAVLHARPEDAAQLGRRLAGEAVVVPELAT